MSYSAVHKELEEWSGIRMWDESPAEVNRILSWRYGRKLGRVGCIPMHRGARVSDVLANYLHHKSFCGVFYLFCSCVWISGPLKQLNRILSVPVLINVYSRLFARCHCKRTPVSSRWRHLLTTSNADSGPQQFRDNNPELRTRLTVNPKFHPQTLHVLDIFLPRDAMHKRGLCGVFRQSVWVSVKFVYCIETSKHLNFFNRLAAASL